MFIRKSTIFQAAILLLLCWGNAHAAAVFETLSGNVRFAQGAAAPVAAALGRRIESGATVYTGSKSRTLLRFDDGQAVLLDADSEFKITDYKFDRTRPQDDASVFDFLKGSMRVVTGLLASRTSRAFSLRTPQATIGVRGTDFMVGIYNPLAVNVLAGQVIGSNAAGSFTLGPGSLISVASSVAGPVTISAATLPAGLSSSFSSMSSIGITSSGVTGAGTGEGAGGGAGAGGGTAGGVGTLTTGTLAAGAALAAGVLGALSNTENTQTGGTTGSTGTR